MERVALVLLDVQDPVRLGGFDDHFAAGAEADVAPEHAPAEGVMDDGRRRVGGHRPAEGVEQAGAAIRHRQDVQFGPGLARRMPDAIAAAASSAERLPLNSCGAIRMRMAALGTGE